METSILLAKFMGPVMLVSALAMLINKQIIHDIMEDFLASPALIFIAGVMALVLGLTVVIFHNHWVAGWPVIITLYGWIALVAGVIRIAFPSVVQKMARWFTAKPQVLVVSNSLSLALGAFLTFKGFLS